MTRVQISSYSKAKGGTETIDSDLRVSLVAAGAAFALSALVGLFAQVAFLALVGRAVLGGLLIGAIVYGAIRLARITLLEGQSAGASDYPESRGRNLDIVLPEEPPDAYGGELSNIGSPGGPEEAVDMLSDSAAASFSTVADGAAIPAEDAASVGAESGKPANLRAAPPPRPAAKRAFVGYEDDDMGEAESLLDELPGTAVRTADSAASPLPDGVEGLNDLDVLPDLEGFTDSFTASEYGVAGPDSERGASAFPARAVSGRREGSDFDPATLAQAVRTFLKKDTKG